MPKTEFELLFIVYYACSAVFFKCLCVVYIFTNTF